MPNCFGGSPGEGRQGDAALLRPLTQRAGAGSRSRIVTTADLEAYGLTPADMPALYPGHVEMIGLDGRPVWLDPSVSNDTDEEGDR